MIPIPERNRQILEMRNQGVSQTEVAKRFKLSPSRIYLIEKRDAAERATAERRAKLREAIRSADALEKLWPVKDLLDAVGLGVVGLGVVTKKSVIYHFRAVGKEEISLPELGYSGNLVAGMGQEAKELLE